MDEHEYYAKELYALFGLAYYKSEVLYSGLCNILVLCTFDGPQDITKPRIIEKQMFYEDLTLGKLLEHAKNVLPERLFPQLEEALEMRNFLAHRFFREKISLMTNQQGLQQLCSELAQAGDMFTNLDIELDAWYAPKRRAFGISDELIGEMLKNLQLDEEPNPYASRRMPKKQEQILYAWKTGAVGERQALVLESNDGMMWELSDIGLAWSLYESRNPNWGPDENVQKFLPAYIEPRPKNIKPWHYTLLLGSKAEIWVRKEKEETFYRWGIRVKK